MEYEAKALTVSVYDHDAKQYNHCFTQQIDLDYEGIFAISASSGTSAPQYNEIKSFKLFDQKIVSTSHHFMDSHRIKAENESWSTQVIDVVKDLIHDSARASGDDLSTMSMQELYDNIALSNYHLHPAIEKSEQYLSYVQKHFLQVSEVL